MNILKTGNLLFFLAVTSLAIAGCKESPFIQGGEIETLTATEVESVIKVEHEKVSPSEQEHHIAVFKGIDKKTYLAVFTKDSGSYSLVNRFDFGDHARVARVVYTDPGIGYKHMMVLVEDRGYRLEILSYRDKLYEKELPDRMFEQVYLDSDNFSDIIEIAGEYIRYDGIGYRHFIKNRPFMFFEGIEPGEGESWLVLQNRGGYSPRTALTIDFPSLKGKVLEGALALTKNIPTVFLYEEGAEIHKRGKGKVASEYPQIEVEKTPFQGGGKIRLPFYLNKDKVKEILIRTVYKDARDFYYWPEFSGEEGEVATTQQGYPAFRFTLQ